MSEQDDMMDWCNEQAERAKMDDPERLHAQIAALTERLRIVEAERDEAHKSSASLIDNLLAACGASDIEQALAACKHMRSELIEWEAFAKTATKGQCGSAEESAGYISETIDILRGELSALRAELERKDAALKEVLVGDANISAWGRRIIDAALQPKEPPCKA